MSRVPLSRRTVLSGLAVAVAGADAFAAGVARAQGTLGQSGLVGHIEGPERILDPALIPKKFQEAPALAELVKAGKLPPVEARVRPPRVRTKRERPWSPGPIPNSWRPLKSG